MSQQLTTFCDIESGSRPGIPGAILDTLANRVRSGGLFVLMLGPDGSVIYHDTSAATFFHRYVLPLVQNPRASSRTGNLGERIGALSTTAGTAAWDLLPGVLLATVPYIHKRRVMGCLAVAAKSPAFGLTEDVVRACGQLGLDRTWLGQQAEALPAYNGQALQREARLLLSMLRDQLRMGGLEMELDALSEQLANTYEELSLVYQLSGGMRVNRRAADFFKQVCLSVVEVLGVRAMGVALDSMTTNSGDGRRSRDAILYGTLSLPPGQSVRLAEDLNRRIGVGQSVLLINDLRQDPVLGWMAAHARQLLAVPLQRQEQMLGCLFALDKSTGEFDSNDSKLLNSIANESAIYLENARLFDDVHDLMMGLLHSLTSAVDAKDAYTCGHSERVALLSRHLAIAAHLAEADAERIYMAGLLHDVGKIGVPEAVLQKTGRLTADEFEQMKKHPQIGARILRDIKQIQDLIPGVLHHHERYDGRGYPAGLCGQTIPLMGRIICLADCFDAMTSNRTYRKALPLEVAMIEIRRCAGTQFDPELADTFLRIGADRLRELMNEQEQQSRKLVDLQQSLRGN